MKAFAKKKKSNVSMTLHLWRDFVMFAIIIMVALWLLQVIFLNAFYQGMKQSEIEKIGEQLVHSYNTDDEAFEKYWQQHSFRGGVFANLLTEDGYIIKSPEPMEEFKSEHSRPRNRNNMQRRNTIADFNPEMWQRFVDKVSESKNHTTTYVINAPGSSQMMVYGAALRSDSGETLYLYLSSPLEPIDTTRRVLQNQLIIVSVLSLLLSLVLAYFIAKRFSHPILRISESARILASGRYDVHFEGEGYREVTELSAVLNSAAEQMSKTDELRRDLMANVSHDLKTPLTIIKSYAEMIRDISGDNKEKRDIHTKVIIDEANRLSLLVNDILNLSRIESGIVASEKKPFSLSDAASSVCEKFFVYTQNDGYTISSNITPEVFTVGDESQITQVIYNLLGNAINYTGADKTVSLSLAVSGESARFEVKDSGDGISETELAYVWERYYRSGRSHAREVAGTGIGLAIVKHILDAHGARYGVISSEGEGSIFWFELPLAYATDKR